MGTAPAAAGPVAVTIVRVVGNLNTGIWGAASQIPVVHAAVEHTRLAGCEWLHVDFEDHPAGFYFDSCGFRSTSAGLINLWEPDETR